MASSAVYWYLGFAFGVIILSFVFLCCWACTMCVKSHKRKTAAPRGDPCYYTPNTPGAYPKQPPGPEPPLPTFQPSPFPGQHSPYYMTPYAYPQPPPGPYPGPPTGPTPPPPGQPPGPPQGYPRTRTAMSLSTDEKALEEVCPDPVYSRYPLEAPAPPGVTHSLNNQLGNLQKTDLLKNNHVEHSEHEHKSGDV